jgi:hypothetical protein
MQKKGQGRSYWEPLLQELAAGASKFVALQVKAN